MRVKGTSCTALTARATGCSRHGTASSASSCRSVTRTVERPITRGQHSSPVQRDVSRGRAPCNARLQQSNDGSTEAIMKHLPPAERMPSRTAMSRGGGTLRRGDRVACASPVPCATSFPDSLNYNHTDLRGDFTDCPRWRRRSLRRMERSRKDVGHAGWEDLATRALKAIQPWRAALSMPRNDPWNP
jgi:hypothetical protein